MARTVFFRRLGAVLLLALLLSLTVGAFASPRFPEKTGNVSDYADVLSADTVKDLNSFQKSLHDATGVNLWITTVHFLDGMEINAYTKELFGRWQLGEEDLMLLMAVGEETYATVAGNTLLRRLPAESQQNLLSANFQSSYDAQQYDDAVARYIPALANLLGKQYGAAISTAGLFGAPQATATPAPTLAPSGDSWRDFLWDNDSFFAGDHTEERKETAGEVFVREEKNSGFSLGKLFVLIILFFLIFGSRNGRRRRGCSGCGCGPLGWIVAGLGLGEWIDRRRW